MQNSSLNMKIKLELISIAEKLNINILSLQKELKRFAPKIIFKKRRKNMYNDTVSIQLIYYQFRFFSLINKKASFIFMIYNIIIY